MAIDGHFKWQFLSAAPVSHIRLYFLRPLMATTRMVVKIEPQTPSESLRPQARFCPGYPTNAYFVIMPQGVEMLPGSHPGFTKTSVMPPYFEYSALRVARETIVLTIPLDAKLRTIHRHTSVFCFLRKNQKMGRPKDTRMLYESIPGMAAKSTQRTCFKG